MGNATVPQPDPIVRLKTFRQRLYEEGFGFYRDAQFELADTLLCNLRVQSFAELTQAPVHRRGWGSAYAAVEQGRQQGRRARRLFAQLLPKEGVLVLALDTTIWPHPGARTLSELAHEYQTNKSKRGHLFVRAHRYSLLDWIPERGQSWALPLDSRRLAPTEATVKLAVEQVQDACRRWAGQVGSRLAIVADTRYGTHRFLGPLLGEPCAVVARLRRDRVLYGRPPPYAGRGRPRKHGQRLAFKELESWPAPDNEMRFDDERWGQVHLRAWVKVHAREDCHAEFNLLLAEVHLERQRRPQPLWLAYQGADGYSIADVWRWFDHRWAIEPSFRFRKQRLHWTLPAWQQTERCDRWTLLVDMAYWQLFLARAVVQDKPLPWQKPQQALTPGRVLQSFPILFGRIGTPTRPVKPRGMPPGWQVGRPRRAPPRHPLVKRCRKS
jgi:hypothetical protein